METEHARVHIGDIANRQELAAVPKNNRLSSITGNPPKVSVVLNVRNGERHLRAAIESILHQSFNDWELIVVDDGSEDRSAEIVHAFSDPRIHLVELGTRVGIPGAINRGIALAGGELIAHLDADDVSHPKRLERQVEFMDLHHEVAGIGTRFDRINEQGIHIRLLPGDLPFPVTALGLRWALLFSRGLIHSSIMFRRSIGWDELDGYDVNCPRGQDYEFWSRMAQTHAVLNLPESLVDFRQHSGSNMRKNPIPVETIERLIARSLQQTLQSKEIPGNKWVHDYATLILSSTSINDRIARDLIKGLELIHSRFEQVYPDASRDAEVRREYAFQWTAFACYLARGNCRRDSMRAYAQALRVDWLIAFFVLPKYIAFFAIRTHAKNLWSWLTQS